MKKPNFLIIMADQMAGLALPSAGHPVVKAPNLDQLAHKGVTFDSTYCSSPLCSPSRASMLSGQLPSRIGVYDNAAEFPASIPTLGHNLRDLGYQTSLCGKMHFVGPDQLHGFEERLTTDIYPADFGWTPDWENPEQRLPWYHNMLSVVQAGTCLTSNQLDFDEEVGYRAVRKLHDMARSSDERPFCLFVSFTHPHDPFAIPLEYWDRYEHSAVELPKVPPIPFDRQDPHSRRLHHVCDLDRYAQTEERVRTARHAYYGAISYIDDKVGELLRTLVDTGFAEDTVVVFTSDHGEMLGERGMWYKMTFFEWAARVPLIIHDPRGMVPRRVRHHVSVMDIVPTLIELAAEDRHLPPAANPMDGRSLVRLLRGEEGAWPDDAVAEILCEGAIAPCFMIRRGPYKYIYSEPDPEQLYNLQEDPSELANLAGRPEHEDLCSRFREEVCTRWDSAGLHVEVVASQKGRRLVFRAMQAGQRTSWDFQPQWEASEQYMRSHMDLDSLERRARYPVPAVPEPDGIASGES